MNRRLNYYTGDRSPVFRTCLSAFLACQNASYVDIGIKNGGFQHLS